MRSISKSKICIVTPSLKNYSETFIQNHIKYFPNSTVVIIGLTNPIVDKNGKQLLKMSKFIDLIDKVCTKFFKIDNIYSYFLSIYFKKNKITHIFCEYGHTGVLMLKAAKLAKLPLITHFHGYDAHSNLILDIYKNSYSNLFEYCKKIIVVSNNMKSRISQLGCNNVKITKVLYGVNNNFFNNQNYNVNSNYFISIGRFVDKKGPYFTVLAFKKVVDIYPQYKLKMVGDGYLLDTCMQLCKFLKLENNIEFCGVKTPEEIADLLSNSLAFVQHSIVTSYNDSEGTPVAIMEAMASGIPVISTIHAGISEIIDHNVTGFLVEECDVDKMAEYMLRIILNPNEAKEIGINANNYAIENFNLEKNVNKLVYEIIN